MMKLLQLVLVIFLGLTPGLAQRHQNPVIPGDHPDPSVIRVGGEYWATTTSGAWEPEFSLFRSRDLLHWEVSGAVFQKRPAWAERDFWAPEISSHRGRFYVYYTARRTDRCVLPSRQLPLLLVHTPIVARSSVRNLAPSMQWL
jgi:beta-xylosidase